MPRPRSRRPSLISSFRAPAAAAPAELSISSTMRALLLLQLKGKDVSKQHEITMSIPGEEQTARVFAVPSIQKPDTLEPFILLEHEELGEGSGGKVFKAVNLRTNELVACKLTTHYGFGAEDDVEQERVTLKILKRLKGSFRRIVQHETKGDEFHEYTFMEYFEGNSLQNHIYNDDLIKRKVTDAKQMSFMHLFPLACSAIAQMFLFHGDGVGMVMRDIKPDNFLIKCHPSKDDRFKLSFVDVGSALKFVDAAQTSSLDGTTPGYEPPELNCYDPHQRAGFSQSTDIYAMGMMLAEIFSEHSYQKHVAQLLRDNAADKNRSHDSLQHAELIAGLPDIFGPLPPVVPLAPRATSKEKLQHQAETLRRKLIALIKKMVDPNPANRISPEDLRAKIDKLNREFKGYKAKRMPKRSMTTLGRKSGMPTLQRGGTYLPKPPVAGGTAGAAAAAEDDVTGESTPAPAAKGPYQPLDAVLDAAKEKALQGGSSSGSRSHSMKNMYDYYSKTPGGSGSNSKPASAAASLGNSDGFVDGGRGSSGSMGDSGGGAAHGLASSRFVVSNPNAAAGGEEDELCDEFDAALTLDDSGSAAAPPPAPAPEPLVFGASRAPREPSADGSMRGRQGQIVYAVGELKAKLEAFRDHLGITQVISLNMVTRALDQTPITESTMYGVKEFIDGNRGNQEIDPGTMISAISAYSDLQELVGGPVIECASAGSKPQM